MNTYRNAFKRPATDARADLEIDRDKSAEVDDGTWAFNATPILKAMRRIGPSTITEIVPEMRRAKVLKYVGRNYVTDVLCWLSNHGLIEMRQREAEPAHWFVVDEENRRP